MHKCLYNRTTVPTVICKFFVINYVNYIHEHNSRSSCEFHLAKNIDEGSISAIGPSLWIKLPKLFKDCKSITSLSKRYKSYLQQSI